MWNVYTKQTNNTTTTTKKATAKSNLFSFCKILRNKLIHVNVAVNVCKKLYQRWICWMVSQQVFWFLKVKGLKYYIWLFTLFRFVDGNSSTFVNQINGFKHRNSLTGKHKNLSTWYSIIKWLSVNYWVLWILWFLLLLLFIIIIIYLKIFI